MDYSVAVNPKKDLKEIVLNKNWTILTEKDDVVEKIKSIEV